MLSSLIILPLLGCIVLGFIPKANKKTIQTFSLFWSLVIFNISIFLLFLVDLSSCQFLLKTEIVLIPFMNVTIPLGVDGLAVCMILLTAFLIPVCVILSWNYSIENNAKEYNIAFLLLESILFGVFTSLDVLAFYLFFEAVLIPMYLIIGIYGSRYRRVRASYLLFLYTLFSSIFMFLAILYLYIKAGSTDYLVLKAIELTCIEERLCWLAFFFSFAVKMPLLPFHIWLPEAHGEAPTSGSVILAGILLKLGGYGVLRFSIGLFSDASAYFTPLVYTISILGVVYASITTLQQVDLKKIIAYSSVGHMGLVTIGLFSANSQGILGSVLLMLGHGIVSSGLFLCVGILYERHRTRVVKYYSGLIHTMPLFSLCFIMFTMGNIGLPGTSNFVGEFLVILGCFITNSWAALLCGSGMVLGAGYGLWLMNRILFGNPKETALVTFKDVSRIEFCTLFPFVVLMFLLGFMPECIICYITVF